MKDVIRLDTWVGQGEKDLSLSQALTGFTHDMCESSEGSARQD